MVSTFHGLELGKRGLFAQQTALSTTGQNIANANTTGYTRQRAEMQAGSALSVIGANGNNLQLGTGVEVNKIVRLREDYLDVQIRGENKNSGYWEAKSDTLSKMEEILNEPTDSGLANTLDQFWSSWQELAKNPDSASARAVVQQRGVAVAETFNHLANSFDQLQSDIQNVIQVKTNEVNSLARQIGSLNDQISRLVPNNYQPNDLYDQRDVLIDQLSKLVDVKVTNGTSGMVDVSIGDGNVLVSGKTTHSLSVDTTRAPAEIKLDNTNTISIGTGEFFGRIESFDQLIPEVMGKINALAQTFADSVNDIHRQGYHLVNNAGTVETTTAGGVDFFTGITNNSNSKPNDAAKNLKVNQAILNSSDLIAAAQEETPGKSSTGNGKNAQAIADLKFNQTLTFNSGITSSETTSTMDDFYRSIIGQVGIDSQEAQRMKDNTDVIIQQVENRRQSVSGVSIDEEMANMIKFQQAYNASARMVTVVDQCLDKVINGMGRVGL